MLNIKFLNRIFNCKELWALRGSFVRIFPRFFKISLLINLIKLHFSQFLHLSHIYGFPYFVMIEPTSRCNLCCPMCRRTFAGLKREERDMSFSEFQLAFDKVKSNLLAVGFWNLGEPLLNKDLFKMVSYSYKERIFSIVLTNGALLDAEKTNEIIESGLDYLGVSMDGASAFTYQKYRKGGDFETVVNNIKFLIEEKKNRKSLSPFVEIIFLVMKDNEGEIGAMIQLARQLKINKLSFKKVSLISAEKNIDISKYLPRNPRFIHAIHTNNYTQRKHCILPWFQITINADGNVVSCCSDYLAVKMGNIFIEKLSKIWNGTRLKNFRRKINQDIDQITSCRLYCAERSYNTDIFLNIKI